MSTKKPLTNRDSVEQIGTYLLDSGIAAEGLIVQSPQGMASYFLDRRFYTEKGFIDIDELARRVYKGLQFAVKNMSVVPARNLQRAMIGLSGRDLPNFSPEVIAALTDSETNPFIRNSKRPYRGDLSDIAIRWVLDQVPEDVLRGHTNPPILWGTPKPFEPRAVEFGDFLKETDMTGVVYYDRKDSVNDYVARKLSIKQGIIIYPKLAHEK